MTSVLRGSFVGRIVLAVLLCGLLAGMAGAQPPAADAGVALLPPPRLQGATRELTGLVLHRAFIAEGGRADVVVVAPADDPATTLAASGLAGELGAGLLLASDPPDPAVVTWVGDLGPSELVVVGGAGGADNPWAGTATSTTEVTAPGGPPAVAAALARAVQARRDGPVDHVLLAGTSALVDAVSAAPWAHAQALPVLLTDGGRLDPHTAFVLDQVRPARLTVLGGPAAVGEEVVEEVTAMGIAVERLAGPDRTATAAAIASARGWEGTHAALVGGPVPVDAVTAGPWAARTGAALLPVGEGTAALLAEGCGRGMLLQVLGGTAAVDEAQADRHRRAVEACDGAAAPLELRVAVAAPGRPDAVRQVVDVLLDPRGWTSPRLRVALVDHDHAVGILVVDGACRGGPVCRHGRDLIVDGAAWDPADADGRARLVNLLLGHRLGLAVAEGCAGTVMDPPACPAAQPWPTEAQREGVAQVFVPTVTIAFTGDIHGERQIAAAVAAGHNPLAPVAEMLSAADLAVVNLETPLSTRGAPVPKTYTFRGPPEMAAMLVQAGVDVATLANNHGLDYGPVAMADTLAHGAAAGLSVVGAGPDPAAAYAPSLHDTPAGRVAVVGLTRVLHTRAWEAAPGRPGLASAYDEAAAVAAVQAADAQADHVVVAIHWGQERADCPDATQRHLARLLVDAGADVIVGHHPHVLQGVQSLDGSLVAYSLGNFVWYHDRAPSRFTGVLEVDLPLIEEPAWRFTPAEIGPDGSPHPVTGGGGAAITGRLLARSPGGVVGCTFAG